MYYRLFSIIIFPIEIHSGIGYGTWDIVMDNESSTAQDGTVYHNARKAIDEAKNSLEYSILFYSGNKNDLIINSLINSNNLLAFKQSKYQNSLMLLTEILYPIIYKNIFELEELKKLLQFIQFEKKESLILDSNFSIEPVQIGKENFYITEGKKRGLSTQISKLLDISRQGAEKAIKTGNIYDLRNLTIAILKAMDNTQGESL